MKEIFFNKNRGCRIVGIKGDDIIQFTRPLDGLAFKGSFVTDNAVVFDSTVIRKSYTRVDGKGLAFVNSDRCPIGDFGVAAQGKVAAYQFGVLLREAAVILLRTVDKEASIVVELVTYLDTACCIFATDGDNEDIVFKKKDKEGAFIPA